MPMNQPRPSPGRGEKHLPADFHRDMKGLQFDRLADGDGWAPEVGFVDGFPSHAIEIRQDACALLRHWVPAATIRRQQRGRRAARSDRPVAAAAG